MPPPVVRGARRGALSSAAAIPSVSAFRVITDAGCLASYGVNTQSSHRKAGAYVAKILAGNSPAEMGAFMKQEIERWGAVIRSAGIKVD